MNLSFLKLCKIQDFLMRELSHVLANQNDEPPFIGTKISRRYYGFFMITC